MMTLPRQILPGRTYLISRRCTQQHFLLPPSRTTNQNVEYCLALAAERTGVLLHSVCVMSNHWHGVITDPEARLPEFLEIFHKLLAKAQNATLGRWENFWSSHKTSVVVLVSENDVLRKMAYTLANPTAAGLVKSPHEWPGVISKRFGEERGVEMPDGFFDDEGELPESTVLRFVRPPIFSSLNDQMLLRELQERVAELVNCARNDRKARGLSFVGRNAVLRRIFQIPPRVDGPRRRLSPRIAAESPRERVDAIRRLQDFVRGYRAALSEWRAGNRTVEFPAGTYALRIYARVVCAPFTQA